MEKFGELFKGTTRCPECMKSLYADVDSKGDFQGLACMNEKCIANGVTRKIFDPKKAKEEELKKAKKRRK